VKGVFAHTLEAGVLRGSDQLAPYQSRERGDGSRVDGGERLGPRTRSR
jgi:hypothetical protein